MEQLISAIISLVQTLVDGYTKNAVGNAVFRKEGEIQNAVIENMQSRYSTLEDKIGAAAIEQYSQQLEEETQKNVLKGNVISIAIAVIIIMLVVAGLIITTSKNK